MAQEENLNNASEYCTWSNKLVVLQASHFKMNKQGQ